MKTVLAVSFVLLSASVALIAQTSTGAINGTVMDSSGAVVIGAQVRLIGTQHHFGTLIDISSDR